ncbi:OmpA family protein [Pelagerythrobacter marensis]|uniref:OmpA family protein n=1 Tax=Pelagerythrobacter marensis TaxID=543877 RepID=A0A0G3XB14_9SPHN|nr:OmpA family protein [Pelagerythrobacter marensis]AKM07826.1 OmpA family protein [Pelagerythrobacter marensis]
MSFISRKPKGLFLLAMLSVSVSGGAYAQQQAAQDQYETTVYGSLPADLTDLPEGPEIEGVISARDGDRLQVTGEDGTYTVVAVGQATEIRARGGFLGLDRDTLAADALLNGLPVSVETVEWGGGLIASRIDLKDKDLRIASMIRNGTAQGFAEQTAATEALRGRMGDIDKYNIRGTANVHFDVGKAVLSEQAKADLCATAAQAEATENALMLVVGYTDSTGSQEFNQQLSEKRASRVVNYLQQACGWAPYRMLTPTGMAEADPLADNMTPEGKAQNRRVAVNILVSKSVEGL